MADPLAMADPAVLLQRLYDRSQQIKALEAEVRADKAALEEAFQAGELEDWLADEGLVACTGFSLTRQLRRTWTYSSAVKDAEGALKTLKRDEEASGIATATAAVSWVVRQEADHG